MSGHIAYSYIRMSTDQQIKGDSLRRQLELSRQWAATNGLALDESLRDIGVSAYKGKNRKEGALGRFLDMVESGQIQRGSYLLVESLDRLSRDEVLEALSLFLDIIRSGINIVTLADQQVYSQASVGNDWSKLIISLTIMARAHEESQRKSQRIGAAYAAKRARAAKGQGAITANTPGWIDAKKIDRDRYEFTLNAHAATVRRIFELSADGLGQMAIAKHLNTLKVPTVKGFKVGWTETVVARILNRRDALGEFQPCKFVDGKPVPDGDPIPGYFPAAIDEDLYMRSTVVRRRRTKTPGRKGTSFSNLFAGLCRCEHCGSPMTLRNNSTARFQAQYLLCSSYMRKNGCTVGKRNFRYSVVENAILDNVQEFALADIMRARSNDDMIRDLDQRIAATRLQIEDLGKRVSRLMVTLETCDEDLVPGLLANMKARKAEKEEASRLLAQLEYEHAQAAGNAKSGDVEAEIARLRAEWETAAQPDRYAMRNRVNVALRAFIDFINFNSQTHTFTVIVLGGLRVYRFTDGALTDRIDLTGQLGPRIMGKIDPRANANDGITADIIPERLEATLKLRRTAQ
ncbi:recombinase family protein [Methylobacterium sp.]|uniref:recombinase family protein n=1 Tax=Methylobacterium sp. TaxID=409 RepID=UPI000FBB584C|nr:recombinase family protein [Methylobacterium sp.]RUP22647.1 MAG: recombinase family protein [Methylobacterium sp.]